MNHRRRKTDKYPACEYLIEQQRDRALQEIETLKAEIAQLKRVIDSLQDTAYGELA